MEVQCPHETDPQCRMLYYYNSKNVLKVVASEKSSLILSDIFFISIF